MAQCCLALEKLIPDFDRADTTQHILTQTDTERVRTSCDGSATFGNNRYR